MSRVIVVTPIAMLLLLGSCSFVGSNAADTTVCRSQDRTEVLAQTLEPEEPSSAFVVEADADVWVSVVADADYNPSALFSGVADLYVIEAGAAISLSRDTNGLILVDDPMLSFDSEGDFVSFSRPPGEYQVWTTRSPEILVVTCS